MVSDLQCPAVVLLIPIESLASDMGIEAQSRARVAGVFVAADIAAEPKQIAAAIELAGECACPVETIADSVDGASLVASVEYLADLHRGEAFIVIASSKMIAEALGHASVTEPVAFRVDASGFHPIARGAAPINDPSAPRPVVRSPGRRRDRPQ